MAYSDLNDLKKKIDEAVLVQLTDTTDSGVVDSAKTDRAIRDADALIDSYAGKVYKVPMSPAPDVITDISATLAIAGLHKFRSIDSPVWSEAYRRAVEFLGKVAQGAVGLEGAVAEPVSADDVSSSQTFTAQERRFSRDLLKGM
ncbi:hypothetical protein MNBD_NITROSPINAE03-2052 [hydrothermal vent metagenome]|uniref:DUF1320 domain-containing protein n=1 Tax=hydrothermal vent metagenome TaxID=652676 RepID=A0A3B1C779_9ZZZZ